MRIYSNKTQRLDLEHIAHRFSTGEINRLELNLYSSCIANFMDPQAYRDCFQSAGEGYNSDYLVINIRGNEILNAVHPHYTVLPPEFYEEIISSTGLRPIFMGQVGGDSRYITRLRARFSNASFIESQGPIRDFTTLRRSKNIVLSISTFSWLAGWLSDADRIHMPLSGFFNPLQYPDVDLIAKDDRFSYYLFPINLAVPDRDIDSAHRDLLGKWRLISADHASKLSSRKLI